MLFGRRFWVKICYKIIIFRVLALPKHNTIYFECGTEFGALGGEHMKNRGHGGHKTDANEGGEPPREGSNDDKYVWTRVHIGCTRLPTPQ